MLPPVGTDQFRIIAGWGDKMQRDFWVLPPVTLDDTNLTFRYYRRLRAIPQVVHQIHLTGWIFDGCFWARCTTHLVHDPYELDS